jgi:hypothetical protein
MTDTRNVYKYFITKLQGKTQLGKYRFRQDDNIHTEPGVSDSTTAQAESKAGLLCSITVYISGAKNQETPQNFWCHQNGDMKHLPY